MSCGGLVMYHSANSANYSPYMSASASAVASANDEQIYNNSANVATPNPGNTPNDIYRSEKSEKYLKPDPCASPVVTSASSPLNQQANPASLHAIQSLDYSATSPRGNSTSTSHPAALLPPSVHLGPPQQPHYPEMVDRSGTSAAAYAMAGGMSHRGAAALDDNGPYGSPLVAPPVLQRLPASCNDHSSVGGGASSSRHHTPNSVNNENSPSDMSKGDDLTGGVGRGGPVGDSAPEGSATYITERCLLVTYFTGDISQVVDEHFSRALSANSQSSDSHHKDSTASGTNSIPLSQRNLPASFWNSDYHYSSSAALSSQLAAAGHAALAAGHADLYDPYTNPALLQASNDPWQNYMAAAASGSAYSAAHRAAGMHDMYSARLNQQYSSLFLQSSAAAVRQGRKDSWGGGGHGSGIEGYGSTHPHYNAMTGLEGTMQSSSKDLYWF